VIYTNGPDLPIDRMESTVSISRFQPSRPMCTRVMRAATKRIPVTADHIGFISRMGRIRGAGQPERGTTDMVELQTGLILRQVI